MPAEDATGSRQSSAIALTIAGAVGWLAGFIQLLQVFDALKHADDPALAGADAAFGIPVSVPALGLFAIVITVAVGRLAGARYQRWFVISAAVIAAAGVVLLGWAVFAGFSVLGLVQLLAMIVALVLAVIVARQPATGVVAPVSRTWALGGFLVVTGVVGWISSFELSVDKVLTLIDPDAALSCNHSLVVQCSANLTSVQGSAFGFPNPLIGLGGFAAVFTIGAAILAGARFARWFWVAFSIGMTLALAFVVFLIGTSIYYLGTLCQWCMLVWSVTIPAWLLVTLYSVKSGMLPASPGLRRFATGAYTYVPLVTVALYALIAVLAQVRLDVLSYL